jgi:hypothetical protein
MTLTNQMNPIKLMTILILCAMILDGCRPATPVPSEVPTQPTQPVATTLQASPTTTVVPVPTATSIPPCYIVDLPAEIATSYAIQGWQAFAAQAGIQLAIVYFPPECPADSLARDGQSLLYSATIPIDRVGLVILNPVEAGVLGTFYRHLVQHEYWQMGPEDYPALLDDSANANRNLVFLRVDELNGDQTIIGNPLTVLTSLAEHEYIHVAQARNNPDLAKMVWTDKDYQYFIEGYANIGNVSSQRYYFETQDAIVLLQNLDLMNRAGSLQSSIAVALEAQGSSVSTFLVEGPPVYDSHIVAFFLRVGGQSYVDGLKQGEISPFLLFTRAGSGDLGAYQVIREIISK